MFGVDPFFLPSTTDNGLTVPTILALLKAKLIQMNGLKTVLWLRCEMMGRKEFSESPAT